MKINFDMFEIQIYPNLLEKFSAILRIFNKIMLILYFIEIVLIIIKFYAWVPNEKYFLNNCIDDGYTLEEAMVYMENLKQIMLIISPILTYFTIALILIFIVYLIMKYQNDILYNANRNECINTKSIITNFDGLVKLYSINPNAYCFGYYLIERDYTDENHDYKKIYVYVFDIISIIKFKLFKSRILKRKNYTDSIKSNDAKIKELSYLIISDLDKLKNRR